MNIEQHVTSYELSVKLKELSFPQDSLFYWVEGGEPDLDIVSFEIAFDYYNIGINYLNPISAYTASELMELLPFSIDLKNEPDEAESLYIHKDDYNSIYVAQYGSLLLKNFIRVSDSNFTNCLAKMAIYLIENNLMEIPG